MRVRSLDQGLPVGPKLKALAYGSIRMQRVWRFTTPASMVRSFRSSRASGRYGHTCAAESRSHMASISPVITKVSGRPPISPVRTVVSRVFGKQFSNIHASSGSAMDFFTRAMVASTASLVNLRSASGGRRLVNS